MSPLCFWAGPSATADIEVTGIGSGRAPARHPQLDRKPAVQAAIL